MTDSHLRSLTTSVKQRPWSIALLIGLLPLLVVILCASLSMRFGLIETCMPLLDGCTSISAACRSAPVIYLFRSVMLPCAGLLAVFWLLNSRWLARQTTLSPRLERLILCCGVTGALFLILYVLFLGTRGEVYEFLRRFGVYVFFAGTAIAQLLSAIQYRKSARHAISQLQFALVITMLLLGPLNLILKSLLADPDRMENIIEWHFGLILCLYFLLSAIDWYRVGFSLIDPRPDSAS